MIRFNKLISILFLSVCFSFTAFADVDDSILNERAKLAESIISEDEGFLADYFDTLSEDQLQALFIEAFRFARAVAYETAAIEDETAAYECMYEKICGENGVKNVIENKARTMTLADRSFALCNDEALKTLAAQKIRTLHKNSLLSRMGNSNTEQDYEKYMKAAAAI